mmetsp:Transcript_4935/g.7683  ORF Transcript_4935/g.7683 Transcript_4935/m.7683 type:complete len:345 (+) Transcript_4935:28-1062(+)
MSHAVAAHAATIAVRAPAERPAPRRQSASLRNRRRASLSSSSASPSDVANAVGCDGAEGEADSTLVAREGEVSRRGALGGAVVVAAASAFFVGPSPFASPDALGSFTRPPAASAANLVEANQIFVGKAGFFMRYPPSWVKAMDRPGGDKGETLALVGNFKSIDTVSVRREPISQHPDFVAAVAGYDTSAAAAAIDDATAAVATKVANVLTSAERSAVAANQDFGVVGGVENGRSGVMDFRLGAAAVGMGPGASPGSSQPYFSYDFYTEVCRASIEEGAGGAKQCVGPRGDVLDTIQRRNFTVATMSGGYLYLVKASALESRWEDVGALLREVAGSFRVPQAELL